MRLSQTRAATAVSRPARLPRQAAATPARVRMPKTAVAAATKVGASSTVSREMSWTPSRSPAAARAVRPALEADEVVMHRR
jgi:hypothetical protein